MKRMISIVVERDIAWRAAAATQADEAAAAQLRQPEEADTSLHHCAECGDSANKGRPPLPLVVIGSKLTTNVLKLAELKRRGIKPKDQTKPELTASLALLVKGRAKFIGLSVPTAQVVPLAAAAPVLPVPVSLLQLRRKWDPQGSAESGLVFRPLRDGYRDCPW